MSFDQVSYMLGKKSAGGSGGTSDYSDLTNKPSINGVTLDGDKTGAQLGIDGLPSVTASDNGKDLTVDNGVWVAGKTANWDATVVASFAEQSVTAEINGTSFTKVSDKHFTASQLDGAIFAMQGGTINITSDMLIDMSSMGVDGTLIDLTSAGFGPVVFSCEEAGNIVSEPGFYLATAMIFYAPYVTMSYTASLTAQTRAIGIGDMEMEDGVTNLPTGVVWLQYES